MRGGKKTCIYYSACGCVENCKRCVGYKKKGRKRNETYYMG